MTDLFPEQESAHPASESLPLAERLRPRALSEFFGQEHLVGPEKPLRLMIEQDQLMNLFSRRINANKNFFVQ